MLDTIAYIFHMGAQVCYWINPFLMIFATCMWMVLKSRMDKELQRMYWRCYALEKQIDFVVNNRDVDREFFNYMTKTYKDLEDKING
jgi:hypothetical protein